MGCPEIDLDSTQTSRNSRDNMNHDEFKDLLLKKLKVVQLYIRLMTPNGAIWSLDQRTVIMR